MHEQPPTDIDQIRKKREIFKIAIVAVVWVILLGLSFVTYFTVPGLILLSWLVIAWWIKARKGDKHDGSPYDEEL